MQYAILIFFSTLLFSCSSSYIIKAEEYFVVTGENEKDSTIEIRTLVKAKLLNGKTKIKTNPPQTLFFFPDVVSVGDTVFVGSNFKGRQTFSSYLKNRKGIPHQENLLKPNNSKIMSTEKKYNHLIEEAYHDYVMETSSSLEKNSNSPEEAEDFKSHLILSKDDFVEEIISDPDFSERKGLSIEERELTIDERISFYIDLSSRNPEDIGNKSTEEWEEDFRKNGVPNKLVVTSYRDSTIVSYS